MKPKTFSLILVLTCIVMAGAAFGDLTLTGSSEINFPDGSSQSTAFQGVSGGGSGNTAAGSYATVGGGYNNVASAANSTVAGGYYNQATGNYSTIGGGRDNVAYGAYSTIAGGKLGDAGPYGTVGGGRNNDAGPYGTVGGGRNNDALGYSSTVSGGRHNEAYGNYSTVGGGRDNEAWYDFSTIGGGYMNLVYSNYATVGGGLHNESFVGIAMTIGGGGRLNYAGLAAHYSTVPGGVQNRATGAYSFAAGRKARANHQGAFVWGDSTDAWLDSTGNNQFIVRADAMWFGQAGPVSFSPYAFLDTSTGGHLDTYGVWQDSSDAAKKENFEPVDKKEILERVVALPIQSWNFRGGNGKVRHVGPTAQDFSATFDLGWSDKSISSINTGGVALAAIQGLNQVVEEKDAEIAALKERLASLEEAMSRMIAAEIPR